MKKIYLILFALAFTTLPFGNYANAQTDVVELKIKQEDKFFKINQIAVKTNLLEGAAMVPNIGVEVLLNRQWSFGVNWFYAWWTNTDKFRFWHTYGGSIEARKWFGWRALENNMLGHHVGYYFMAGRYDFAWGQPGYQSNFTLNTGIAYGYATRLSDSFSMDFSIGVRYINGEYKKYYKNNCTYCYTKSKRLNYFGPSNAQVSLVWHLKTNKPKKVKEYEIEIITF